MAGLPPAQGLPTLHGRQRSEASMHPTTPPIACTLNRDELAARLDWIGRLGRQALLGYTQNGLVLELRYRSSSADLVRKMVSQEEQCCAFLSFALSEAPEELRLTITAPPEARDAAGFLFEQFVGNPTAGATFAPRDTADPAA